MLLRTSWFQFNDGNYVPPEFQFRLHYLLVTYLVSHRQPWSVEKGDMTSFFVEDLARTGASGENVSPPTTGLQKGQ